jgi:hypothetical protein
MMNTATKQIDQEALTLMLKQQGVVHIKGMFVSFIPLLRETWEQGCLAMAGELKLSPTRFKQMFSTFDRRNKVVQQLVNLVESPLSDLATKISSVEKAPVDFSLFMKSPQAPDATHAHQDISYRWNRPQARYSLTTWLALDDADEFSGALDFMPGSHLKEIEPRQDFIRKDFKDYRNTLTWKNRAKTVQVQAGDVLVFDARIWHSAWPLTVARERRALALRWRDSAMLENINIPEPIIEPDYFGMDTSGRLLVEAVYKFLPGSGLKPEDTIQKALDTLFAARPKLGESLDSTTWKILEDFQLALQAQEIFHVRVGKTLWHTIGDRVLPTLKTEDRP